MPLEINDKVREKLGSISQELLGGEEESAAIDSLVRCFVTNNMLKNKLTGIIGVLINRYSKEGVLIKNEELKVIHHKALMFEEKDEGIYINFIDENEYKQKMN